MMAGLVMDYRELVRARRCSSRVRRGRSVGGVWVLVECLWMGGSLCWD
jgi:hypothetical protein